MILHIITFIFIILLFLSMMIIHKKDILKFYKKYKQKIIGIGLVSVFGIAGLSGFYFDGEPPGDDPEPIIPEPYIVEHFIPPSNSFGIGETNFTYVNWSFFWQKFRSNSRWNMEGWHPIQEEWVSDYQGTDLDDWLNISRIRSDDNSSEKITLNFTSPYTTKYRFTFGIDARVLSFVNKTDRLEYVLTYPINNSDYNYTVYFNWSDLIPMLDNGTISVNHGIKNINGRDVFWFRIITNVDLQQDKSYELDPTFGETGDRVVDKLIFRDWSNQIFLRADYFTADENGEVQNITCLLNWRDAAHDYQCAIYEYVDYNSSYAGSQLGITEIKEVASGLSLISVTFDLVSPVSIVSGTNYYLCVRGADANPDNDVCEIACASYTGGHVAGGYGLSGEIPVFDDPLTTEETFTEVYPTCIYATYIPQIRPSFSNPNPANGDYNVSFTQIYNITITEDESNTSTVDFYISTDNSSWTHIGHNTSILNESVSVDLTGHTTLYDTIYYMKTTANDTQGNNVSFYSSFETTPYRTNFFNTTFNTENWVQYSSNLSFENSYYNLSRVPTSYWDIETMGDYCEYDQSNNYMGIERVVLNTLNKSSSMANVQEDYSGWGTNLTAGETYQINVTVESSYDQYLNLWIDWNDDGDWADAGEWCSGGFETNNGATDTWLFTVPENAVTSSGLGMRVASKYNGNHSTSCDDSSYGDCEFYSVAVFPPSKNDGYIITKNITRQNTNWDKFYCEVNNTDNSTFSLIDGESVYNGWVGDNGLDSSFIDYASNMGSTGHLLTEAFDATDYWDASTGDYFIIDLGFNYTVEKFKGRSLRTVDPIDVSIWVSKDNSTWGSAVVSNISTWQDTSDWVNVDCTDKIGRYIKVFVNNSETPTDLYWGYYEGFDDGDGIFDVYVSPVAIISNLNGDGDDISSVTNATVRVLGEFNATLSLDSINLTWSAGGAANNAPTLEGEIPANTSSDIELQPTCNITVKDADADTMTVTFYSNFSGGWVCYQKNTSVSNSTSVDWIFTEANSADSTYYWRVYADDGTDNTSSDIFYFVTLSNYSTTIRNDGEDYFVWTGQNITASQITDTKYCNLSGFDEADEYIAIWEESGIESPTYFGNTSGLTRDAWQTVDDTMVGTSFKTGSKSGNAYKIKAFISNSAISSGNAKAAIYNYTDDGNASTRVGFTNEETISYDETGSWITFTFPNSSTNLLPNTKYFLVILSDDVFGGQLSLGYNSTTGKTSIQYNSENQYPTFMSPLVGEASNNDREMMIYCIYNGSGWDDNYGLWNRYYGDSSGTDFTLKTFDVVKIILTDSGVQTFNMAENTDYGSYTNSLVHPLRNLTENKGYNYSANNNATSTTLSAINTSITLQSGEGLALWNETNYAWDWWLPGFYEVDKNVHQWDVIITKVEDDELWNT